MERAFSGVTGGICTRDIPATNQTFYSLNYRHHPTETDAPPRANERGVLLSGRISFRT